MADRSPHITPGGDPAAMANGPAAADPLAGHPGKGRRPVHGRRAHEPPQKGNPHGLTVDQHILPRATIARFCGANGNVHVHLVQDGCDVERHPRNAIFCANRAWDQRAEDLSGKVENAFQAIARRLAGRSLRSLEPDMHMPVTEMYLLWRHRCFLASQPIPDMPINLVEPERGLSQDAQELLESKHVLFVKPDGTIPGRVAAGVTLQRAMEIDWLRGADAMRWGVVTAPCRLEFIVPDAFVDQPILPVAPDVCLVSGLPDAELSLEQLAEINAEARSAARRYWFARNPPLCPALRPAFRTGRPLTP